MKPPVDGERTHDAAARLIVSRRAFVVRTLTPGLGLLAVSVALGAWIFARGNDPFVIDAWWNTLLADWPSEFMTVFSQVMNVAGGTWFGVVVVPLGIAILLIVRRRPWAAAYFLTAEAASAGVVQVLKHTFGRARPEDIAVVSDFGSFPSGHVANAATILTAIVVLFPRLWTLLAGIAWVLLMALSRTYLHAHWLTDTLGGALAGTGSALVVAAAFAVPILAIHAARAEATAVRLARIADAEK